MNQSEQQELRDKLGVQLKAFALHFAYWENAPNWHERIEPEFQSRLDNLEQLFASHRKQLADELLEALNKLQTYKLAADDSQPKLVERTEVEQIIKAKLSEQGKEEV